MHHTITLGKLGRRRFLYESKASVAPLTYTNGYDLENVGDMDLSVPMNWNVGVFSRPEFENIYICFLMHWHFNRGLYSLQDAITMDPDKFHISTTIHNELILA